MIMRLLSYIIPSVCGSGSHWIYELIQDMTKKDYRLNYILAGHRRPLPNPHSNCLYHKALEYVGHHKVVVQRQALSLTVLADGHLKGLEES